MRPGATAATVLCALAVAHAHGGHEHGSSEDHSNEGYIRSHMSSEHHIDTFDLASFFKLHDLDNDGLWDRSEIEAVYGVHHDWNPKDKDLVKIKEKADRVVARVLELLDSDRDNRVSMAELERAGFEGLPDLKELGAEGHHYDVESEFFLHHEELYHSTPETQTDEAYNHPEDDEHFANHEHIEAEEERRERVFQGLPLEGDGSAKSGHDHEHDHAAPSTESEGKAEHAAEAPAGEAPPPSDPILDAAHPHDDQAMFEEPSQQQRDRPKIVRQPSPEKLNPTERFKTARGESQEKPEWGEGDDFKRPKTPADRMRRNVPYKYKFKRNWGDF